MPLRKVVAICLMGVNLDKMYAVLKLFLVIMFPVTTYLRIGTIIIL